MPYPRPWLDDLWRIEQTYLRSHHSHLDRCGDPTTHPAAAIELLFGRIEELEEEKEELEEEKEELEKVRAKEVADMAARLATLEGLAGVVELAAKIEERMAFEAKPNGRPLWVRTEAGKKTVDLMRQLRVDGMTNGEVAVRLNSAGLTTPTGKPWDRKTVHHFAAQTPPDSAPPPPKTPTVVVPKPPKVEPYWTAPATVATLLEREQFEGPVWEPCCGTGVIAESLLASGYEVHATDRQSWGYAKQAGVIDVLEADPPPGVRSVVTNPPFSGSKAILQPLCRGGFGKVAVLLPLGGWARVTNPALTGGMGLRRAYHLGKVPFWDHDRGRRFVPRWPSLWFVLEAGYTGSVEVLTINRG